LNIRRIGKIVGIVVVLVIIVAIGSIGFIIYDVMSYTATGSQTLQPNGTPTGTALVVYDPGVTGAAKNVADTIAKELQSKGYQVDLAGIRSTKAVNTAGYNVIVVGGPIYARNASSSIQYYLKNLRTDNTTKVAVFATGQDADTANNYTLLLKEVAPLPANSTVQIKGVLKIITVKDDNQKISEFVNTILQ
jgi:flavodoxin